MRRLPGLLLLLLAVPAAPADAPVPDEARLRAMTARFAPVDIGADLAGLPASERAALVKMIEAARVLDPLYLRQVWGGSEALLLELVGDRGPLAEARLGYFLLNKGPWSQLDHHAPGLARQSRVRVDDLDRKRPDRFLDILGDARAALPEHRVIDFAVVHRRHHKTDPLIGRFDKKISGRDVTGLRFEIGHEGVGVEDAVHLSSFFLASRRSVRRALVSFPFVGRTPASFS